MQTAFWKKPIFWTVFFIILIAVLIPLFFYFFKKPILSILPSNLLGKDIAQRTIQPGHCLILEKKFCSLAEVIDWTNPKGERFKIIGFHLPPGTPLLVPIDGKVTKAKLPDNSVAKGSKAQVVDPYNPNPLWHTFTGDLEFDDMRSPDLKKGATFGHIGNTGITNAGGYNLIFYIIRGIGAKSTPDIDQLKNLFPSIKL